MSSSSAISSISMMNRWNITAPLLKHSHGETDDLESHCEKTDDVETPHQKIDPLDPKNSREKIGILDAELHYQKTIPLDPKNSRGMIGLLDEDMPHPDDDKLRRKTIPPHPEKIGLLDDDKPPSCSCEIS